jgi:hypothetical protein
MSSCSIQNGGRRRGGKRSRKSHRGGNDLAPAPAPVAAPAPAPVAAPASESTGFLSGFARGVTAFTETVGNNARKLSAKVTGTNLAQEPPLESSSIPSEQSGGRRRKKSKTARKSRKSRRLKRKRSRKSRK